MIIITILKGKMMTAKRFILNETSYHGQGAAAAIIDEIKSRGFNKALIVTDADLIKFGVVKKITDLLEAEGFAYAVFDGVKANPSVGVVKAGVKAFKAAGADYMIAVGGGSPQDTAKGIGIIINNPEFADVVSLEGTAPTRHKSVPVIAVGVPTVVDAFSLFRQAELELDVPRGVLVTMQDVDTRVREMGRLVGYSCDLALHRGLSLGEIPAFLS